MSEKERDCGSFGEWSYGVFMEKEVVLYELQLQLAVVAANRFCEGGESDMEDDDRWSTTWNGMSATLPLTQHVWAILFPKTKILYNFVIKRFPMWPVFKIRLNYIFSSHLLCLSDFDS